MADERSACSPYSGNVIAPLPGRCFRYVPDDDRGGYPGRCIEPVRWRGVVVDPASRRIVVESCEGHAAALVERRAVPRMPFVRDPIEEKVRAFLDRLGREYEIMDCDPAYADTAAFCDRYGVALEDSANTIVVVGKGSEPVYVACVVLATTRLDVNGAVRSRLGVRKASFASAEDTVAKTGMMIGGVTVLALPDDMAVWVDAEVMGRPSVVVGGGSRSMKVRIAPDVLLALPGAEVVEGLAR